MPKKKKTSKSSQKTKEESVGPAVEEPGEVLASSVDTTGDESELNHESSPIFS